MDGFTPGPWTAEFCEFGGYDCMSDAWDIVSGNRVVAVLDLRHYGQEACSDASDALKAKVGANARLMAAAPELLALVKVFAAGEEVEDDLDAAHGLIARIEGR